MSKLEVAEARDIPFSKKKKVGKEITPLTETSSLAPLKNPICMKLTAGF
jgi:hypothetical protein